MLTDRDEHHWDKAIPRAVSYTHLDVYKRQIVGCANQAVDVALLVDRPTVFIGVKIDS